VQKSIPPKVMAFVVETCRRKFCRIKQTSLTVWICKPSKCSGTEADIATFVDRLEHACFICMCGIFQLPLIREQHKAWNVL
jgi:hypothetical protein